jgi:hypothetical protein
LTFDAAVAALEKSERDPQRQKLEGQRGDLPVDDAQRGEREAYGREQAKLFAGLTAMMRLEPEVVGKAMARIKRGSVADKALLDALASSRTALGETALIELVTHAKVSRELRAKAASSLIRLRAPSEHAVAALRSLLDDQQLGVHAHYGLGTFARHLREAGELSRSDAISQLLMARLAQETSDSEKAITLRALANSACVAALDSVRPFLTSDNASLRLAAVQALRLMDHPDTAALIAARLTDDRASKVRLAAIEAAAHKPFTLALKSAVERVASEAPDAQSRLQAAELLNEWSREHPELRDSLARIAKNEREPTIKAFAERSLGL